MKIDLAFLNGTLPLTLITGLALVTTLTCASTTDPPNTSTTTTSSYSTQTQPHDIQSKPFATLDNPLGQRDTEWGYDNWVMICADNRHDTFDCQSHHFYCDNDGALRRLYDNGRGDGGCPLVCLCMNPNPKPQCVIGLTGMSYCIRDGGVVEPGMVEREETGSVSAGMELCGPSMDGENEDRDVDNGNISARPRSFEPEVKPGSSSVIPTTNIPVSSGSARAMAGKWSRMVEDIFGRLCSRAVGAKVPNNISNSTPSNLIDNDEPNIKPGGLYPIIPSSSNAAKAAAGKWSRTSAGKFHDMRGLTFEIVGCKGRKGRPSGGGVSSSVTRCLAPNWAKRLSRFLRVLKGIVRRVDREASET